MKQRSEYDLMANCVEFMQQTTSPLSEGDNNVCNSYLMKSTYLRNSPKVKAAKLKLRTSISGTNASSLTFMPFAGASFSNDCHWQPMLHCFSSLTP